MHKLMIKTHTATGLKYLCYTRCTGKHYENYKGSGKRWRHHLKTHGDTITTELIFESDDKNEFIAEAKRKSYEFNVVESDDWANLKIEECDGGDTVSNRQWVTDGFHDKYIYKTDVISEGWVKGRSNCVFNDKKKQEEFRLMQSTENKRAGMASAWASGKMAKRDNTNLGMCSTPESRKKISDSIKRKVEIEGVTYDSCGKAAKAYGVSCALISHWIKLGKAKKYEN